MQGCSRRLGPSTGRQAGAPVTQSSSSGEPYYFSSEEVWYGGLQLRKELITFCSPVSKVDTVQIYHFLVKGLCSNPSRTPFSPATPPTITPPTWPPSTLFQSLLRNSVSSKTLKYRAVVAAAVLTCLCGVNLIGCQAPQERNGSGWSGMRFKLPGWYLQIIQEINQTMGLNISLLSIFLMGKKKWNVKTAIPLWPLWNCNSWDAVFMSEDGVHGLLQPTADKSNRQPELLVVMCWSLNLVGPFTDFISVNLSN